MNWIYALCQESLSKERKRPGEEAELPLEFERLCREGSLKILVQEPWMGTIRFKALARYPLNSSEIALLVENPMKFLVSHFGGGKFKINIYRGMHFMATKNFKPEGPPAWRNLPEYEE